MSSSPTAYVTPARDAHAETHVRGSRFLGVVRRVGTEEEARAVLAALRREHPDARHHCSAFVLGADAALQRSSDDGEPSGTAGAPMLDALRGAGVSDAVVVVVRWFGGTLLGAGGLVRAYGDTARAALDLAGTQRRTLVREVSVDLDHASAGRVEGELRARGVPVLDTAYAARVTLLLGAPAEHLDRLEATLAELTAGAARPNPVGERWVDQ